jgi:hypothetical protein
MHDNDTTSHAAFMQGPLSLFTHDESVQTWSVLSKQRTSPLPHAQTPLLHTSPALQEAWFSHCPTASHICGVLPRHRLPGAHSPAHVAKADSTTHV